MTEQLLLEQDKEDELVRLLNKLPQELRGVWEIKTNELEIGEAILLVRKTLDARNSVKEKIFTKINDIENPELREEVRGAVHSIHNLFGNQYYLLGSGTIAKVYSLPQAPHVCVKYIVEDMLSKHGNAMRHEVEYLEELQNFSVEGVRVPKVYFQHMSDEVLCFGMETIDGLSLDKIISDPGSCDFLDCIKKQDRSEVLRKIKSFIKKLHEDMKLVHRDLATRNIMVDRSGNWYVIDFGKAKRIEIGDSSTDISEETDFPTAESAIRELFVAIS